MVVRPVLTYASVVWWSKTDQATTAAKLERVQRLANLAITGAMSTTPNDALNTLLGLPKLSDFIKGQARMSAYRLEQSGCWKQKACGHSKITKTISNWQLLAPSDHMIPVYDFSKNFETSISSREEWKGKKTTTRNKDLVWYTDGSKMSSGTGAGIYGPKIKRSKSVPMGLHCTVFQAEVYAIIYCLWENIKLGHIGENVIIYTDSQAAIKALESVKTTSKLVWECKKLLKTLASSNKVTITWVPGHAGIEGNEEADELARRGSATPLIGPEPFCGLSYCNGKLIIDRWLRDKADKTWNNTTITGLAKRLVAGPSKKLTRDLLALSRKNISKTVGLLTGHCQLRKHLSRIGVTNDSILCRRCNKAEETAEHAFLDCEALAKARYHILGPPGKEVDNIRQDPINTARNFIKRTGLLSD